MSSSELLKAINRYCRYQPAIKIGSCTTNCKLEAANFYGKDINKLPSNCQNCIDNLGQYWIR